MEKLISALIIALITASAPAATIYVDANGTGDYPTVQAAINDANDGDTIILQPGTYTGDGNRDIDFLGKAITVRSTDPNDRSVVEATVIDCNGTDQDNHRGFYFINDEGQDSVLEGLTITNGYTELWGGGGAIYIARASPTISKCIVTNNHADLFDLPGFCYGGGIKIVGTGSNPLVTHCIISNNSVGPLGHGGGISCDYESKAIIQNCLITNNTALGDGFGGGIYCDFDNVTTTNCTIAYNSATESGGGIFIVTYDESFTGTVANNIIWNNSPNQIDILFSFELNLTYSDIQGGWPGIGNIDVDPYFADTSGGDYHLKSQAGRWNSNIETWVFDSNTSPCIDAGNPGCPPGAEPDPNGNRINMGAYGGTAQASKSPDGFRSLSDLNNDWQYSLADLSIFVDYWLQSGTCLPADLDRDSAVDFEDYAVFTYDPCSGGAFGEPNVVYTIEGCDEGLMLNSDSNDLRFTVTVDGQYVLFEDMMLANCCPEELVLQMTVEGNLITIQEIEYLGEYPCTCLCDHPVTATLGPFSSGIYTLEVYQEEFYGGFIGSTAATIP
jgi:hypothetical protein